MCSNTGDVRLVGSVNMTEGRLEICVNDYWGTVCNDGANDVFDRNAAEVVCRQLGFPESGWLGVEIISLVRLSYPQSFLRGKNLVQFILCSCKLKLCYVIRAEPKYNINPWTT